jgi:hypothetical protein
LIVAFLCSKLKLERIDMSFPLACCAALAVAEELDMLANDMDVERNGFIPLEEFKDVLVRRQDGYDFTGKWSPFDFVPWSFAKVGYNP